MVKKSKVKKKIDKKLRILNKNKVSLELKTEHDIAMDFATKVYQKFNKIIKSVILFGSTVKQTSTSGSDIDIIIVIDDVSIKWDQELIVWYREELDKILRGNPYQKSLHINTIKLSTWWEDLMRGDPTLINVIRYGEAMLDFAGFFEPIKSLLINGKIKSTPEAIYSCLQRAPIHISRSRNSILGAIDGLYWSMVDSSHAALISVNVSPPSPEHIAIQLKENFIDTGKLKMKYAIMFKDLMELHKKITHGDIRDIKGVQIDEWQRNAEDFMREMVRLVNESIKENKNLS